MKILVIDDDDDIRRIIELALLKLGKWEVIMAGGGKEGLLLAQSERPDLILLDVMMPGMDGPTMLKILKEDPKLSAIPVIFVTAKVQKQEVESYTGLGAIGVISKPFDPLALPSMIIDFLNGYGLISLAQDFQSS